MLKSGLVDARMIITISVITRTGYNEQIRLGLRARYIRFLLYFENVFSIPNVTFDRTPSDCNIRPTSQDRRHRHRSRNGRGPHSPCHTILKIKDRTSETINQQNQVLVSLTSILVGI